MNIKNIFKIIKQTKIIKNSEYFDVKFYKKNNLDLKNYHFPLATHYLLHGWKEGRNPCKQFDSYQYLEKYEKDQAKENPIIHLTKNNIYPSFIKNRYSTKFITPLELFYLKNPILKPLKVQLDAKPIERLNVYFYGFERSEMFGGKVTELVLAILFCNKFNYHLRIISNTLDCSCVNWVCDLFNIPIPKTITFFNFVSGGRLSLTDKDCFLCTMWVNARSLLDTQLYQGKIFYMMQEYEMFFYNHSDEMLLADLTLRDERLTPIVNSKLLFDYFVSSNYTNVMKSKMFFNPVFDEKIFHPSEKSFAKKDKYKLFFYGRPNNSRNLFHFALLTLDKAFMNGILDPDEWEIFSAGGDIVDNIVMESNVPFKNIGILSWKEYSQLLKEIDLCFSLMYTPHPSYPPLDAASSGAVVVTNKYLNKQTLDNFSKNILLADLNEESIFKNLLKASEIVKNPEIRKQNYEQSNLHGTWDQTFGPILEKMKDLLD